MNRTALVLVVALVLLGAYIWNHNYTYTRWNGYQARVHNITYTLEAYSPGLRGWARVGLSHDQIKALLQEESRNTASEASSAESDYYSDPAEKAQRATGR